MRTDQIVFLKDSWYLALSGHELKAGELFAKTLLGEPLVFGRQSDGTPFALKDICPHRGIPLHHGSFNGNELTCCYHGWKFGPDGHCTEIPSLLPDQDFGVSRIRVKNYPCKEVQGNIWIFFSEKRRVEDELLPEIPRMPDVGDVDPQVAICMNFPCNADQAAFGLMDPTHAAFVHTSWWWKKQSHKLREKQKEFEPIPFGWRMKRHRLPPQNRMYKLFGDNVTTDISYCLPGLRIEHIRGNLHTAVGLTAITPLNEQETEVHQCLYWTLSWLNLTAPLIRRLAWTFLGQDRKVVVQQQEGLSSNPPLMLIDDADTQAKWYHLLKREWISSHEEGRPFNNPIQSATLRWRS